MTHFFSPVLICLLSARLPRKGDSAEDYAFARAGFTADDGKPFAEVDIKLVDEGEIFDVEIL